MTLRCLDVWHLLFRPHVPCCFDSAAAETRLGEFRARFRFQDGSKVFAPALSGVVRCGRVSADGTFATALQLGLLACPNAWERGQNLATKSEASAGLGRERQI